MKPCILATLLPCIPVAVAQIPPNLDPSQVVSGITSAGHYDYRNSDGTSSTGTIIDHVDPQTGTGVIITIPDHGPITTTLVHPGLSVTY